jgi:hypothetical protein
MRCGGDAGWVKKVNRNKTETFELLKKADCGGLSLGDSSSYPVDMAQIYILVLTSSLKSMNKLSRLTVVAGGLETNERSPPRKNQEVFAHHEGSRSQRDTREFETEVSQDKNQ